MILGKKDHQIMALINEEIIKRGALITSCDFIVGHKFLIITINYIDNFFIQDYIKSYYEN